MLTIETILHPTDFSDLSAHASDVAHSLARDHGARLILLHVHAPQEVIEGEFGMLPPEPELPDEQRLEKLQQLIPEGTSVATELLISHGNPAEEIVRISKDQKCSLIVMSTHGRHGLSRLFLGSVADTVARKAHCPVLTLRSSHTESTDAE